MSLDEEKDLTEEESDADVLNPSADLDEAFDDDLSIVDDEVAHAYDDDEEEDLLDEDLFSKDHEY